MALMDRIRRALTNWLCLQCADGWHVGIKNQSFDSGLVVMFEGDNLEIDDEAGPTTILEITSARDGRLSLIVKQRCPAHRKAELQRYLEGIANGE